MTDRYIHFKDNRFTQSEVLPGVATEAQGDKADAALPADGGTLQGYAETGAALTVNSDGDGTYSVTVPFDGKRYNVTLTQDVDIIYGLQTPPALGSAVLDCYQDATGNRVVSFPAATTEWQDGTVTDVDSTASSRSRVTMTQVDATQVDVEIDYRAVYIP